MSAKNRATAIFGVILGILLSWTALAPSSEAAPGYTHPASISLSASVAQCGGHVTVTGTGFAANEVVTITLHSKPVVLTTVTANGSGNFSVVVNLPAGVDGHHTIVATGATGDKASAKITIESCGAGTAGGSHGPTAVTGVAIMAIGGLGVLLLAAGTVLLIGARRRRRVLA